MNGNLTESLPFRSHHPPQKGNKVAANATLNLLPPPTTPLVRRTTTRKTTKMSTTTTTTTTTGKKNSTAAQISTSTARNSSTTVTASQPLPQPTPWPSTQPPLKNETTGTSTSATTSGFHGVFEKDIVEQPRRRNPPREFQSTTMENSPSLAAYVIMGVVLLVILILILTLFVCYKCNSGCCMGDVARSMSETDRPARADDDTVSTRIVVRSREQYTIITLPTPERSKTPSLSKEQDEPVCVTPIVKTYKFTSQERMSGSRTPVTPVATTPKIRSSRKKRKEPKH